MTKKRKTQEYPTLTKKQLERKIDALQKALDAFEDVMLIESRREMDDSVYVHLQSHNFVNTSRTLTGRLVDRMQKGIGRAVRDDVRRECRAVLDQIGLLTS